KDGQDRLGAFRELGFRWRDRVGLRGSIRAYVDRPVLLFTITSDEPVSDPARVRFPRFTGLPRNLRHFSYANEAFAPASFALEENGTPWLLYDVQGDAAVLPPAPNSRTASMWDNGAQYYYDYDRQEGYAGTLEELVRRYRDEGIPIRYLQLDSWWYYKTLTEPTGKTGAPKNPALPQGEWNRYGGLLKYEAHPALFRDGLAAFQKRVGLPLIAHNRWIDPASPYRERYRISGLAAV